MKKVWKYITLTLLLLLGVCCIGILYLFFVPGSKLFNVTYIYKSKTLKRVETDIHLVDAIVINSRSYDVNILPNNDNEIKIELYANSFGFVLNQNKSASITSNLTNNTLTYNITEPHGFALKNNSYINLYLPSIEIDLTLTNKNATTTINHKNLSINKLNISTNTGKFDVENCTINNMLNLNLNSGIFNLEKEVKTNKNDVLLKLSTARFNATHTSLGNVTIEKNNRGVVKIKECQVLSENIKTAGGQIYVDKLTHINVSTSDTDIFVKQITDGAGITLTKSGDINITTLTGSSTLETNSGNILVNTTKSAISAKTNIGNIKIKAAYQLIKTETKNGTITVNFAKDAESHLINSSARKIEAFLKNGTLNVTGVENVNVSVSEKGNLKIEMLNVYGNNLISGKNGNVNVVINHDSKYILTTASKKGKVRVNLTQTVEYNGYTTKEARTTNVNCNDSNHSLNVYSNAGNLTVLDTKLA